MNKNQRCQGSESTNGPCRPCPASPQASLSPSMAQDPISAQPGAVSPCPSKAAGVLVSGPASGPNYWMDAGPTL